MGKKTIAKQGRSVQVHYKGSFEDGTVFDSSYDRGEAIEFTVGAGEMIPGFDNAVEGMKIGETKTVKIESSQETMENIIQMESSRFPRSLSQKTSSSRQVL